MSHFRPFPAYRRATRRTLARQPSTVTALHLEDADDALLESLSRFSALRELYLWRGSLGAAGMRALGALPSLRSVLLYGCATPEPEALDALYAAPSLEHLEVSGCWGLGLAPLLRAQHARGLRELSLAPREPVTDAHLASLSGHATLTHLSLSNTAGLTAAGLGRLPALEGLALEELDGLDVGALASMPSLRALSLWTKATPDTGMEVLARLPRLEKLRTRRLGADLLPRLASLALLRALTLLGGHQVTREEILALEGLPALEDLELGACPALTDELLESLSRERRLRRLRVSSCGQLRCAALRHAERWSELRSLDVSFTALDDEALAWACAFPKLEELEVNFAKELTARGTARLLDAPALSRLRAQGLALSAATMRGLAEKLEELTVYNCAEATSELLGPVLRARPSLLLHGPGHLLGSATVPARERYRDLTRAHALSSGDGSVFGARGPGGAVHVYDRGTGAKRTRKPLASKWGLVLDAKGERALVLSAKSALLEVATGAALAMPEVKLRRVDSGAFSPDGRLAAIAGLGGTARKPCRALRVWALGKEELALSAEVLGDSELAVQVDLSPDGERALLTGSQLCEVSLSKGSARVLSEEPVHSAAYDAQGRVHYATETELRVARAGTGEVLSRRTFEEALRGAPCATLLAQRDALAEDPERVVRLEEPSVEWLTAGPEGLCAVLRSGSELAVLRGDGALWLASDGAGALASALLGRGRALALTYPSDGLVSEHYTVGFWELDALFAAFSA